MNLSYRLKNNFFLYLLKLALGVVLLMFIYTSLSFFLESHSVNENFKGKENNQMLELIDSLADGKDFIPYSNKKTNLEKVNKFYGLLNSQEDFTYLSIYGQPIGLRKSPESENFIYDSDYDGIADDQPTYDLDSVNYTATKSLQLNKASFDYYKLSGDIDHNFSWNQVDLQADEYPIFLGYNYKNKYKLGEIFEGEYLFRPFKFKIVGFLNQSSAVFYRQDVNFYLDNYLIFPYPEKIPPLNDKNFDFERMLLFNLINGDIIYQGNIDGVMSQVESYGRESQFEHYSFINVPNFYIDNLNLKNTLEDNRKLIIIISFIFIVFVLIIMGYINNKIFINNKMLYKINYLSGVGLNSLKTKFILDGFLESLVIPLVLAILIYKSSIMNSESLLILLVIYLVWLFLNIVTYSQKFKSDRLI